MWENMTSQSIISMYQAIEQGFQLSELDIIWNPDLQKLIWNREFYKRNQKLISNLQIEERYQIFDCLGSGQMPPLIGILQYPYALIGGKLQLAVYTETFFYFLHPGKIYYAVNIKTDEYYLSKNLKDTIYFLKAGEERMRYRCQL